MKQWEKYLESEGFADKVMETIFTGEGFTEVLSDENKQKVILITDLAKVLKLLGKRLTTKDFDFFYDEPINNIEKALAIYQKRAEEEIRKDIL
jgi:hypothetical protein